MHTYLHKIDKFVTQLAPDTLIALENISATQQFKKGEYLLRQDQVCRSSFYITDGIARKFYLTDGKEVTSELLFPDDIAVSFHSYCLQKPSREYIQALTDISVSTTDYHTFEQLKRKYPKLLALDLMLTEYYTMWLEERLFRFHTLSATQRYQLLVKEHPAILQHIQLTHIASFLGISLETLSRIRAKLIQ